MGWFAKGSVQHGRNRISHSLLHFERFWRAMPRYPLKILISLLGFERFLPAPSSMLENLRAKRLDPFLKINIDEGGGVEIEQKLAVLM